MSKPHIVLKPETIGGPPRLNAIAHEAASYDVNALKGWAPRRGSSADADLLIELPALVSRARDADRNNGIARGGVQTILDNVVGTGLRLSARPDYLRLGLDKAWAVEWAQQVESYFCSWAWTTACHAGDRLNLDQIVEQALRAKLTNGDAIMLPLWMPDRGDGFATKLFPVEGDRLSNPNGQGDNVNLRAGIQLDEYGAPLGYFFRSTHPADVLYANVPTWTFVERKTPFGRLRVIHDFDADRVGQSRGKPLLTAIMRNFKQIDRYIAAEIDAAVVQGMVAGIIETPLEQDAIVELFSKDADAYQKARAEYAVRMEPGSMLPLFPGDKLNPFIPSRPAAAFGTFVENVVRIIGVALDLPYELVMRDFSKTNYSSARAALLEAWRGFNRRRDRLGTGMLDPVYGLFLEELVNDGRIKAPGFYENRAAYQRCRWIGPGRGWIDPVKEAEAARVRVVTGVSTLEDECADQGRDWREVMEQAAVERAERERLGLPDPATIPTSISKATADPGGQNEAGDPQQSQQQQQQAA